MPTQPWLERTLPKYESGPPVVEVQGVTDVGEVLREEDVFEDVILLSADRR